MNNVAKQGSCVLCAAALLVVMLSPTAALAQTALTFDKSFAPGTIGPGSVSTLAFAITNNTLGGARSLAFTDSLPAGVTIASPANATTTCLGTVSAPDGGGTISFSDGELAPSASCSITVDVTSSTVGTHTNVSGTLTSSIGGGGTATADLTVATDRPGFSKSSSPAAVFFGGRSTLTFTVDNTANTGAAFNLTFTDNLPFGMTVASPSNKSTDCGNTVLTATSGGSIVSLSPAVFGSPVLAVAANASCTVTVDVIGGAIGVLGNTTGELTSSPSFFGAAVSSGKAAATLTVSVEQIALTKSFTDDPVAPGGSVTLSFTVLNLDRSSTATNITFTDDLDAVVSGLVATNTPLTDPCGSGSSLSGTSLLTLSGGSLAPEASCSFSVVLQVPGGAAAGSNLNTTSSITADLDGTPVTGDPASDVLFVAAVPVLTKEFRDADTLDPDPVVSVGADGDDVVLRFTVTNTSTTSAATDIAFTDELTTFLPFPVSAVLPATPPCGVGSSISLVSLGVGGQGLSLAGGNLAAASSCDFDVTVNVPADVAPGTYLNTTGEITATIGGETVTGNPASDTLDVIAAPELVKTFVDDPVAAGGTVNLQFVLTHDESSLGDATDVTFSDDLTATLAGLAATGLPVSDVCGSGSQISGTTNLMFTGGTLAPGESCAFTVTLQVPSTAAAGAHANTTSNVVATVLGKTTTNIPATDTLNVAGLVLSKEFTDDPVIAGSTVNLRFTITNSSPVSHATAITFLDDLDTALENLAAAASSVPQNDICGTGSSLIGSSSRELLTLTDGTLLVGESCTFDVTLDVPVGAAPGTYLNSTNGFSATIDGSTTPFEDAQDDLVVSELVVFTKEFTDDPVLPGGTVTLRFALDNLVPGQDMTSLAFSDDLDDALGGLVATGLPISACGGTVSGTAIISLTGGSLLGGTSCTFDVTLAVPATVPPGTVATNVTSEVTGLIDGVAFSGDPATDQLQIESLTFSKAFDGPAAAGGPVSLTFTIQNVSTTDGVSGLSFSDDLDGVIPGLVATGLPPADVCGTGSTLTGTSFLTFTDGSLLPGGSCTITVVLQIPADTGAGLYPNVTSQLRRDGGAPAAAPATATLQVVTEADLSITKMDSPDPVSEGGLLTYTVTVSNAGPSNAQNVVVTDTLPAGVTLASTAGCAEDPNGVPACSLGTIEAGFAKLYTIEVSVDIGTLGVVTNTASVASDTSDPNAGNNSTSEDTDVGALDDDGDGVPNGSDLCSGTVIPEGVPTVSLGVNRFALVDDDFIFDTTPPNGGGPGASFDTEQTGGCSCEQIIEELHLGNGHTKFGCSLGAMRNWVDIVDQVLHGVFDDGFESGEASDWSGHTPEP